MNHTECNGQAPRIRHCSIIQAVAICNWKGTAFITIYQQLLHLRNLKMETIICYCLLLQEVSKLT